VFVYGHETVQRVPVKIYESSDRLTIAALMPGIDANDMVVEITPGNQLDLHGNGRVLGDEWNPEPWSREITLPAAVDGNTANATYCHGILIVALPLSVQTRPARIKLEPIGGNYGEWSGTLVFC
jgi:HSP20 family protein